MALMKNTTQAGELMFVRISGQRKKPVSGEKRREKCNPSIESVVKLNDKNAERNLQIIISENFTPKDYHMVFTYDDPPSIPEAKKNFQNFIRRLTTLYKNHEILLKYVYVTEYVHTRIHHHVVITGGIDLDIITKKWGRGFIFSTPLRKIGDYRALASYLIKETKTHFRTENAISKRRFNCSKSIVRPDPKRDDNISSDEIDNPVIPYGYYIDADSKHEGTNPVTGKPFLEYVLIPMKPEYNNRDPILEALLYNSQKYEYQRIEELPTAPRERLGLLAWLEKNTEYQINMFDDKE